MPPSPVFRFIPPLACLILLAPGPPRAAAGPKSKPSARDRGTAAAPPAGEAGPVTTEQLRALSWRSIGPANMGGRVSDIGLVPGKPSELFVGTGTGGLFKTTNGGTTFSPVFDDQAVLSIGSVAIAPSDPKIVYVGTGEGNGRNSSTWGNGVYKSTDGGGTFAHLGLDDSRDIPRLAIHPKSADVVYAAVMGHLWDASRERGLYKTSDGGKTWQPVLQIDENHGCIDVVLDPSSPDVVYAAMYARRRTPWSFQSGGFGDKGGIYKSTDGGRSFKRLTEGLPRKTGRIGLALFAGNPGHVFAVIESDEAGPGSIGDGQSRAGRVFLNADGGARLPRLHPLAPRTLHSYQIVLGPQDE